MSEENKALAGRYLDEIWNKGNSAARDQLTTFPEPTEGVGLRAAFPDIELIIEDQIAEGDRVVTRHTMRGTHKGEYEGASPTNKLVTFSGTVTHRIEDGKLVERWNNWDKAGLLQQIGAIPPQQLGPRSRNQ